MDLGVSLIRLSPVLHSGRFGEEDTDPPPRLRVREFEGGVVMLGYGGHEAQPQTASRAMARGIQAHESFEDTVSLRFGDSGAVVRYGQLGASVLQPGRNDDVHLKAIELGLGRGLDRPGLRED